MSEQDGDRRAGLLFSFAAFLMWGAFPLYFPLLEPAGTIEILASRMAWSLIVVLVLIRFTGGLRRLRPVLRDRRQLGLLTVAAALISVNWGVYIWGVNNEHVVECSLGYFINPLFTIVLGVVVLRERLRRAQWAAVGIGAVAVLVIAIDYGQLPWIALTLAVTFGCYGFCKKKVTVGAAESLAVETGVLFVPAVVALTAIGAQGDLEFGHRVSTSLLLAASGVVTALPLLCFAAGARRLPLSVMGLLQYLTPVLQFAVGVGIRHEPLPTSELIGFVLVWVALIVLTVDGLRHQRRTRRPADAPAAVAA